MKGLMGGPIDKQSDRKRCERVSALALVFCLLVGAAVSRAGERPVSGAWLLGLELQQRNFDTMSAGDARPLARGDAGVRGSIDRLLTPRWSLSLSAHFGGTWFDVSDPLQITAGKIEDAAWDARCGVDRVFSVGAGGMGFVGAGIEYGEARSWAHTLGTVPIAPGRQEIADEGPRSYRTGGYARLEAMTPLWRRMALCAQVSESFYGAHASDPPFGTQFNWLGRALAVSVGLRFEIARGRMSAP
jgi:hypothetical protein